jgi:hypothetical protein
METLFAGIGDAVGGVAQILDDRNMRNIEKDAYAGVDPLRDQQGVEAAIATDGDLWGNKGVKVAQAGGPMALNKPPAADDAGRSVRTLTDAFNAGKIGPTQYYTRLEVLSRQMRTRYPGYRSEVDKTIQSITGINPANSIVRQVNSDLEEQRRAAQSGKDDMEKRINKAIMDGMVPLSVVERYYKGEASGEEVLYEAIKEARNSNVQTELNKQAEYLSKTGGDWKTVAERGASNAASSIVTSTILNSADSVGLFNKARALVDAGKLPSPEEQAQLTSGLAKGKSSMAMALDKALHTPTLMIDGVKQSYATAIGPEMTRKIKEEQMSRWESLEQMVINKEYGLLTATARDLKAQGEAQQIETMKEPIFKALAGIPQEAREWIGPVLASSGMTNEVVKALQNRLTIANASGTGSFTKGLDELSKTFNKDPGMWKNNINMVVKAITDPKAPLEVRKNFVKSTFGDKEIGFLSRFKPEQHATVFSTIASPQVTEAVKALKDPEAWRQYENWTRDAFNSILKTQFQSVASGSVRGGDYVLTWDGSKMIPEMTDQALKKWNDPNQTYRRNSSDRGGVPDFSKIMGPDDWKALQDINTGILTLSPVVKNGGGKVEDVVMQTLQSSAPAAPKSGSMLEKLKSLFSGGEDSANPEDVEDKTQGSAQDKFRRSRSQPEPAAPKKQSVIDIENPNIQLASFTGSAGVAPRRNSRRDGPLDFDDAKLVDDAKVNPGVNIDNVDPALRSYGESLSEKWGITITSGHRDPFRNRAVGGATNSQHIPGKALDFSLRGLPVEDRMALIDEILNNPEVGGIGMYGDGSIHVDYRKGGKAAWGSDRSSLDGTPTWFRQRIERWRGKDI